MREIMDRLEELHPKVEKMLENPNVSGDLRREFKGKTEQYLNMFESLQEMKAEAKTAEGKEGIGRQQLEILTLWEEFELEMIKRIEDQL